jgi:ATP-dependent helicase/nuclease subunit A
MTPYNATFSPHLLIKASAGTGKTYQLTNRYLQLLASGVSPASILATTFTKKAAFEIKERLFTRLAKAVVGSDPFIVPGQVVDAGNMLQELIFHQDKLLICTIDAFCGQLARNFASELGLGEEWRFTTPEESLWFREIALQHALSSVPKDQLDEIFRVLEDAEGARTLTSKIDRQSDELLQIMQLQGTEFWGIPLYDSKTGEKLIESTLEKLRHLAVPCTKNGQPNKNWTKARESLIDQLVNARWYKLLDGGLLRGFVTSNSYSSHEFDSPWKTVMEPLKTYVVRKCVQQLNRRGATWYQLGRLLEQWYLRIAIKRQAMGFQDIKYLLQLMYAQYEEGSPFLVDVFYRLDARIQHILLDEFQDTSLHEWQVLLPFMQEVISTQGDRTFFCVGDVKQAIYNWRGGRAGLLSDLPAQWQSLELLNLDESWRSSEIVLEFCNEVFGSIEKVGLEGHLRRSAEKWSREYPRHRTRIEAPGYVECNALVVGGDGDVDDLAAGVAKAGELFRAHPAVSIAILVRTNDKALVCANLLRERFPDVSFSVDGNISFTSDPAVRGVLSALNIIEAPHSTFDRFYLATCALGRTLNYTDWRSDLEVEKLARVLSEEIAFGGVLGVVRYLVDLTLRLTDKDSRGFCYRLLSIAAEYRENSVCEFVKIIKEMTLPNQGRSRLSIMTIHKAKGLEFDAVILVDLNQAMISQVHARSFLTHCESPFSGYTEIVPMPKKILTEYDPELLRLWQEAEEGQMFEALSILYVAITRARYGLYVYMPAKPGKMSFAAFLEVVTSGGYAHGDENWYVKLRQSTDIAVS